MALNKEYVIKIEGVDQSITSVDELKSTISSLNKELESATFGSDQFNELTKQVNQAEAELSKIQET